MSTAVTLYMLVGIPCVGKSTWLEDRVIHSDQVLSTDNIIEQTAASSGATYSESFKDLIKIAERKMYTQLEWLSTGSAADTGITEIYWDQTNLTKTTRAKKLAKLPVDWKKIAVFFDHRGFEDVIFERNKHRPGKIIPENVLNSMMNNLQVPSVTEGFDEVMFPVLGW